MLKRLIQSSQPIFSLILYIIFIPVLWYTNSNGFENGNWALSILALIALAASTAFVGFALEKADLVKNTTNAAAFALLICLLITNVKHENFRELGFLFCALLSINQTIKIYKEDQPGAQYLVLGIIVGLQFILLPLVGILSIAGVLPYILFGAGIRVKGILSYACGIVICIYLYYASSYLFNLDLGLQFGKFKFDIFNIINSPLAWLGPILLLVTALLVGIPGNLSLHKDLSVERRFYQRVILYHSVILLIQGTIMSTANSSNAFNIIGVFATALLLITIFGKSKSRWVSSLFLVISLLIFIGRSFII